MTSLINSTTHVITNFTYYDDVAAVPKPEPLPDWPVAKRTWRWCWVGHVYGFGSLYVLVAAFASVVLVNLNRRLRFQPLIVAIDVFLFLFGLSKSIFLFGDAYHSVGSMPDAFVQLLHGLTFPIVIATFSLLEILMSRLMRVPSRVRRSQKESHGMRIPGSMALWVLLTAYFLLVIGVYVAASKRRRLRYLLVLTQAIFITWGFVLCFMFTYNSFVAARYAKETGKALRQIVTYCRVRKQLKQNPNARHSSKRTDLNLHRIDRPAFDGYCEAVVDSPGEEGRETTDSSSAESFVFYNEASLTLNKEEMLKGRRAPSLLWNTAPPSMNHRRLSRCKRRHSDLTRPRGKTGHASVDSDDYEEDVDEEEDAAEEQKEDLEEENNYVTSGSTGRVSSRRTQVSYSSKSCVYVNNNNIGHHKDNSEDSIDKSLWVQSRDGCRNPRHGDSLVYLELLQCHPLSRTNHAYRQDSESQSDISTVEGSFQSPLRRSVAKLSTGEGPFEAIRDTGYMADAEVDSPKPLRKEQHKYFKRRFRLLRGRSKQDIGRETKQTALDDVVVQPGSPPPPGPYSLPVIGDHCSLGLNRIRQGRLIKKVFTVAYLTTAAEFVMCVVQVYALFGVFGVFSNVLVAAPWPWLAFQTVAR